METRNQRLLLAAGLSSALLASALQAEETPQVIEPEVERRTLGADAIDSENIEIGLHYGIISIEDFDSADIVSVRAAWHVTEDLFFEASYGQAEGDLTSYEQISGGLPLFGDDDRDYRTYNLSLGWNVLPGEVFIGDRYAFNSALYLIAGAGSTDFLGDNWFTVSFGAGYRLLLSDSFAWHIDVRDHLYDREIFTIEETTHNIEFSTGFSFFF